MDPPTMSSCGNFQKNIGKFTECASLERLVFVVLRLLSMSSAVCFASLVGSARQALFRNNDGIHAVGGV